MTPKELAAKLHGNEMGDEISKELELEADKNHLVVVFGYSDDNAELRGSIDDEVCCCDGGKIYIDEVGLLVNECDEDSCPYHKELRLKARAIEAIWDSEGYSWIYKTDIPHETFDIMENGEKFCRGIVFKLF